jgi:gamma-glutamyltranspeptidase / glutathione hydrolase
MTFSTHRPNRRELLKAAAAWVLLPPVIDRGLNTLAAEPAVGRIDGHIEGARAGMDILAARGNAVDAAVAAALVASVVAPYHCGPGGYGGSMMIASADGRTVAGIDFNTVAPAAARPDMFHANKNGPGTDPASVFGWKAVGVPGILAGMQHALDRFGTKKFPEVVAPAIRYTRDGFATPSHLAYTIQTNRKRLAADPGSAKLLLPGGEPPVVGSKFKNPDLATMLETLAQRGSVESFYKGDIAGKIAAGIRAGGGIVTEADLAAYRALDVEPLSFTWNGLTVRTPPPGAGGGTALETLAVLKALKWDEWDPELPKSLIGRLEALRLAWDDRLKYFGDPTKVDVPLDRLLGDAHATELAAKVEIALRDHKPAPAVTDNRSADGTQHLSIVDSRGMMVAVTLTHGGYFGAQVTVDGLGLTLGHGMSRFNTEPGHANSVTPGKRPLHNMSPAIVFKDGKPEMALGGRGGRKIPNAVFEVLAQYMGRNQAPKAAIMGPRIHSEGGMKVELEKEWPEAAAAQLQALGYAVTRAASATVSAVWRDPATGAVGGASR